MANLRSSKKDIRKTKTRTLRNRAKKDGIREARRSVIKALESGDVKGANEAMKLAMSRLDKAAKSNTIHKNKASRLKSRLAARIKKVALGDKAAAK